MRSLSSPASNGIARIQTFTILAPFANTVERHSFPVTQCPTPIVGTPDNTESGYSLGANCAKSVPAVGLGNP